MGRISGHVASAHSLDVTATGPLGDAW